MRFPPDRDEILLETVSKHDIDGIPELRVLEKSQSSKKNIYTAVKVAHKRLKT